LNTRAVPVHVPEALSGHGMEVAVIGDPGQEKDGLSNPNRGKGVRNRR